MARAMLCPVWGAMWQRRSCLGWSPLLVFSRFGVKDVRKYYRHNHTPGYNVSWPAGAVVQPLQLPGSGREGDTVFDYLLNEAGAWESWASRAHRYADRATASTLYALPSLIRSGSLNGPFNLWSIAFDPILEDGLASKGGKPANKAIIVSSSAG